MSWSEKSPTSATEVMQKTAIFTVLQFHRGFPLILICNEMIERLSNWAIWPKYWTIGSIIWFRKIGWLGYIGSVGKIGNFEPVINEILLLNSMKLFRFIFYFLISWSIHYVLYLTATLQFQKKTFCYGDQNYDAGALILADNMHFIMFLFAIYLQLKAGYAVSKVR